MRWIHLLLVSLSLSCLSCDAAKQEQHVPADFLVNGLDEIEPAFSEFDGQMFSGLLPMDNKNAHGKLQFWLFAPSSPTASNTLTIWLNGGPGCSSFFAGVFFEHSPVTVPLSPAGSCCISQNAPFVYNHNAWTTATHMLYIEQPIGVGFSSGSPPPQDEHDVARDFHAFLDNFYSTFTLYQNYELYIFGESYAGMYVPAIAHELYKNAPSSIPLTGIGIGNGLLDSRVQGPMRIDWAFFHGMIDSYTRDVLYEMWDKCMHKHSMKDPFHSFDDPDDCGMISAITLAAGHGAIPEFPSGPNVYDVTTWDPYMILKGNNTISRFYNNPRVKEKLHAPLDMVWQGCVPGAGRRRLESSYLINDKPKSTVPYIAELLNGGIRVLMYNGDRDMACNAAGTDHLLNKMKWKGADEWYTAPRGLWTVDERPAGYAKTHLNLQFVILYNSGHLAPYNVPEHALDLITRFLTNTSFYDYDLPNFGDYLKDEEKIKRKKKKKLTPKSSLVNEILSIQALEEESADPSAASLVTGVIPILLAFVVGFGVAIAWQNRSLARGYRRIQ